MPPHHGLRCKVRFEHTEETTVRDIGLRGKLFAAVEKDRPRPKALRQ
jgi:hypothetical protein